MNKKTWVLGLLLAGGLSFGAAAPVAMRVELEPRRQAGDLTEVVVVVQVSPEDRIRIGANAIIRVELDGGTVSSGSPMRAVRLEDDGSTRFIVKWPPGEHDLRVEIEDSRREDTGLWVGTVRIPDLSPKAMVDGATEIEPMPESAPASASAPDPTEPESEPDFNTEGAIDTPEEAVVVPVTTEPTVPEPSSEPAPEVDEPEATEATVEETPEPPAEETTAIVESAAVGKAVLPEIPEPVVEEDAVEIEEPEPESVEVAEGEPEDPPIEEPEPLQIEEPAEIAEEPPLVEPLRGDTPSEIAEPETVAPSQKVEAAPVPADLAAQYEEWGSVDPDVREFSMIVTRGREPAKDVDVSTFQLRVGGSRVPVERLGNAANAPLLLGLAIDVAADEVADWSGMQGSLSPIVGRAAGSRGRLFVATADGVGAWDAEMDAPGGVTLAQTSNNVAGLVVASIERFRGLRGRTFLVVLTDGRDEPTKEEWLEATITAGEAGVPILVIALWDDQFNSRVRKNLKKLTEISGGSLFLVQGRAQLESAADRFGRYLDGGYSVRFKLPGDDRQSTTSISVSASDKELDVSAPKSIR